jgi:alpha-mannosidase
VGYPSKNDSYQYCYIYKYEINIPQGAKIVTLPNNQKIKIFAITVVRDNARDLKALQPLYDDFQTNTPIQLRGTAHVVLDK